MRNMARLDVEQVCKYQIKPTMNKPRADMRAAINSNMKPSRVLLGINNICEHIY